jgi:hypothetical protein
MVRPYRPLPGDFRVVFLRLGWGKEIEEHYRTNYRCIARWVEEAGGEDLRVERAKLSGGFVRPLQRSKRYIRGLTLTAVKPRLPSG